MSVQPQVADHYNQIKQKSREERQLSDILGVKRFNNWIKSVLIHRFSSSNGIILDLCCGKGGDLNKFVKAHVHRYVGADHAIVSLQHAVERYNELVPLPFEATFIAADCHSVPLVNALPEGFPKFDLVSCQFALHYSFETEARARMFTRNIGEHMRPGGFFVATFPNSTILQLKLRSAIEKQRRDAERQRQATMAEFGVAAMADIQTTPLDLKFGNDVYSVRFTSPCPLVEADEPAPSSFDDADDPSQLPPLPPLPKSPFGVQYHFDLKDAISDCPEYLVHMPTLCSLLAEYDLELVHSSSLHQFFVDHSSHPEYARLMKQMKVMGDDYARGITPDEWECVSQYTKGQTGPIAFGPGAHRCAHTSRITFWHHSDHLVLPSSTLSLSSPFQMCTWPSCFVVV